MKNLYFLAALALACAAAQAQTSFGNVVYPAPNSAGTGGGSGNSYFGHNAGNSNTAGQNTFLGAQSGLSNTTGDQNTFVGSNSGYNNLDGTNNSFVGFQSGYHNTTGYENSAFGSLALYWNNNGNRNTVIGTYALHHHVSGNENTAVGHAALGFNQYGESNVAVGFEALAADVPDEGSKNNNTAIGYQSGGTNTGSGNVFIGYQAGQNEAGSNRLYIDNSHINTPLIWGDFAGNLLNFNGNVGIRTESPSEALQVTGNVRFSGALMPNNSAGSSGQVLTSAGAGAAPTWTTRSLNGLTGATQTFAAGSSGTNFSISSSGTAHTFNLPSASAANRGLLTAADWTTFNNKANINSPNFTGNVSVTGNILWGSSGSQLNTNQGGSIELRGNGTIPFIDFSNDLVIDYDARLILSNDNTLSLDGASFFIPNNGGGGYTLQVNGDVGKPGGASWIVSSDRRLKQDISPFTDGLEKIKQIKPVWYRYNGLAGLPTEERYVGIIAQEMQEVAPYTVGKFVYQDSTGVAEEYLNYDGSAVTYMLINAIKEQQQQLEAQQKELETLKNALYGSPTKTPGSASGKTSAESESQTLPGGFALYQNVPNPFDRTTVIGAQLPESVQQAKIVVYNLQGLELASYPLSERGKVSVEISGGRFPAGMYLYALLADGQVIDTKKMILTD